MVGKITYVYQPDSWSQDEFLKLGGFTVVFLNYNKSFMIEKSVASALDQDFPLLEMFFMDDASTDGSGEAMEAIVRKYRGRHKVSVVRNSENQRIAGQWNIAAKLATGRWLGMFCADDVQYPNRVSLVAERIKRYPKLKGICTAVICRDYNHNERLWLHHYNPIPREEPGFQDDPRRVEDLFDGCSSFWHRSLFGHPLPPVNLDDLLLKWVMQLVCENEHGIVWTMASDLITLEYSVGTGITSKNVNDRAQGDTVCEQWMMDTLQIKSWYKLVWLCHIGIGEYFREHHASRKLMAQNRWAFLMAESICGNTLSRFVAFPSIVALTFSSHLPRSCKLGLWRVWFKKFIQEIFGIRVAAWATTSVKKLSSMSRRWGI